MTFEQAIQTPKRGWKYANDEQTLASLADILARICCLNAEQVFEWAKKYSSYPQLRKVSGRLTAHPEKMELLDAVLNDHPLG